MAEVGRVFIAVVHRQPMWEVDEAMAVESRGLEGCIHGRPGSRRQVLLMDEETLRQLDLSPGVIKENITTRGVNLRELRTGQRLRVGLALLEVTEPCGPCRRMDEIREGLRQQLQGRRGMLCRVVGTGRVRRGDKIEVLDYAKLAS